MVLVVPFCLRATRGSRVFGEKVQFVCLIYLKLKMKRGRRKTKRRKRKKPAGAHLPPPGSTTTRRRGCGSWRPVAPETCSWRWRPWRATRIPTTSGARTARLPRPCVGHPAGGTFSLHFAKMRRLKTFCQLRGFSRMNPRSCTFSTGAESNQAFSRSKGRLGSKKAVR